MNQKENKVTKIEVMFMSSLDAVEDIHDPNISPYPMYQYKEDFLEVRKRMLDQVEAKLNELFRSKYGKYVATARIEPPVSVPVSFTDCNEYYLVKEQLVNFDTFKFHHASATVIFWNSNKSFTKEDFDDVIKVIDKIYEEDKSYKDHFTVVPKS